MGQVAKEENVPVAWTYLDKLVSSGPTLATHTKTFLHTKSVAKNWFRLMGMSFFSKLYDIIYGIRRKNDRLWLMPIEFQLLSVQTTNLEMSMATKLIIWSTY